MKKKGRNLPQFYQSAAAGALFLKRDTLWQRAHQGVTGRHTTQRARRHTRRRNPTLEWLLSLQNDHPPNGAGS